ncbi:transposase [Acetobacter senegalensis]|uniref:Transposase n=1 Tax=Acetobacter senegalensis TaxID=446692 RepID=A0A0U4Y826_9PROT|nr:transposase [Acetobacter senegalensis]
MSGPTRPITPKHNEAFMEKEGFVSKVHRKKPHIKPMPRHIQQSNVGKSIIRPRVEHVFADQKAQTRLFIRTVGITRATTRIGLARACYDLIQSAGAAMWMTARNDFAVFS